MRPSASRRARNAAWLCRLAVLAVRLDLHHREHSAPGATSTTCVDASPCSVAPSRSGSRAHVRRRRRRTPVRAATRRVRDVRDEVARPARAASPVDVAVAERLDHASGTSSAASTGVTPDASERRRSVAERPWPVRRCGWCRRGSRRRRSVVELVVVDEEPGARELVDELDGARLLVRGDALAAPLDELVGRRARAVDEHDDRLHGLHPDVVGHADHRAVGDGRMGADRVLDLGRIDVLGRRLEHPALRRDERERAVGLEAAEVVGVVPAVA